MEYNQRGSKHNQHKPTHNQDRRQQSGQQKQSCQQNQQTWQQPWQHKQQSQHNQQPWKQNQQQQQQQLNSQQQNQQPWKQNQQQQQLNSQQQIQQPWKQNQQQQNSQQQNQQPWKQSQQQQQLNSQIQQQDKQSWKQNQQHQQHNSQPQQQNKHPWQLNQQPKQQISQQQNKQHQQQPWQHIQQQPWQQNQQPQQHNSQPQQPNKQPWQHNQQHHQQNEQIQPQEDQQNRLPKKYANQFQQPPPTQSLHSSSDQTIYPPPNKTPHPQITQPIPPSPTPQFPYPPPSQGSHQNQMHTFQQPATDLKSFQNMGPFSNTTSAPFSCAVGAPSSWPYVASPDDSLPQTKADNRDKQQTEQTMNVKSSDWNLSKNSIPIATDQFLKNQIFIPHQSSMQTYSHQPHGKAYPPQRAGQESHMQWEKNTLNVSQAWPSNMPPPYSPPVGEVTVELTEKDQDQQWIDNFVSRKINVKQPTNRKYNNVQIKIPEAKNMIRNYRRLLDDLKLQRDLLVENVDIDCESWQLAVQQVSEIKRELQRVSEKLNAPDFICRLTEKLKLRQKRTLNLKRQRKMEREDQQEHLDRIEEVDKKINADIAKADKEREERLKEKQLQKEIDTTLFEVRKKKKEADKTLEILRGLRKLRHVRKASSLQKGVVLPISSETIFEQRISQMEQFMNRQRAVYTAEEQAMQVMLEEEQEESKEKERQMLQERLKEREVKQLHLRRKLLFGNGKLDPSVIPFNQFYQQTDVNIDAFLHVRYTWDQCLVFPYTDDAASSIPVAWATPEPPSSRIWKTALDD